MHLAVFMSVDNVKCKQRWIHEPWHCATQSISHHKSKPFQGVKHLITCLLTWSCLHFLLCLMQHFIFCEHKIIAPGTALQILSESLKKKLSQFLYYPKSVPCKETQLLFPTNYADVSYLLLTMPNIMWESSVSLKDLLLSYCSLLSYLCIQELLIVACTHRNLFRNSHQIYLTFH